MNYVYNYMSFFNYMHFLALSVYTSLYALKKQRENQQSIIVI